MCGQGISKRGPKGAQAKGDSEGHLIADVMEMLKNISLCLASFTLRFEIYVGCTLLHPHFTSVLADCLRWRGTTYIAFKPWSEASKAQ